MTGDLTHLIFNLFFLFPSLYPSAQSLALPLSHHTLMNESIHKKAFLAISQKLMSADSAFFASKATNEHISYLFECEIEFDMNSAKMHSLDLSNFPTIYQTNKDELTLSQKLEYEKTHSSSSKIPKKLVSDIKNGLFVEHVEILFFMIVFFSAKIKSIKSIISFKIYDFLKPFSIKMSKLRASTPSSVLKGVFKNYSNRCVLLSHIPRNNI